MTLRRPAAALGSALFFLVAPTVVAGLVPLWLAGWGPAQGLAAYWLPLRVLGLVMIVAGASALIHAFVGFVVEGAGTPAPVAPTDELVVRGLYQYVRNPMYLAVLGIIVGQALLLGRPALLVYAAAVAVAVVAFVHGYEEPTLSRRHGRAYHAYRDTVPGWWPRRPRPPGSPT